MLNVESLYFVANRLKMSVLFIIYLLGCVILPTLASAQQSSAQNENPAQLESSKTIKLHPIPLDHVRLTGGPLKAAQEADAK